MNAPETVLPAHRRVLVVEDDRVVRDLLETVLTEAGYVTTLAASGEQALEALGKQVFDAVILDLNLPGIKGMDILHAGPSLQAETPFVVLSAQGSIDSAVEAMKLGAFDYITKPFRVDELLLALDRAHADTALRREVAQLRRQVQSGAVGAQMVGRSAPMEHVRDLVARVAPSRATVLITGETGTGKEVVARLVHALSPRAERAFLAVNCAAIPETLLEAELFGHMKGAFTGAIATNRGLMEEASGSTLFLDEIGAISLNIQVKLLRVLQERTIMRVGGREPIAVDARIVAATNRDLGDEVRAGRFREDLYYRLNVVPIRIPALRERPEDIPLLAAHFLRRAANDNGVEAPSIPPGTMQRLMAHQWPGNVRELENFIERAVIMGAGARTIVFDPDAGLQAAQGIGAPKDGRNGHWNLEQLERSYILAVLDEVGGHQARAAEVLGIDRRTLYRKLKQYRADGPHARDEDELGGEAG
ncbi:MAG: sigma-54-dependent transcriptional regulator [Gemmatimonadales bacterium]